MENILSPQERKLRQDSHGRGYLIVNLSHSKGRARVFVHRFIAYCKFGDDLFESDNVRHLDGCHANNGWENIAIGSFSDNHMDKPKEVRLRSAKVAASYQRKLSDSEVHSLRRDRSNGFTYKMLCEKYGLAKSTVSYIVRSITYADT